jgi:hypothetical protein
MPSRRFPAAALAALLLASALGATPFPARAAAPPFAVASAGPQAGARVDATVTRLVGGRRVTLPAAVVPALEPGDQVDIRFVDFIRPAAQVNYHVNVAFLTESAPQHWLFPRSGPWDRLFVTPSLERGRRAPHSATSVPDLRFTYGVGDHRGIPIVFIVPEDDKTRGMDGVRDYVDAHPTDFKDMAVSSNDAVSRYQWFSDFLGSLSQGAIDPVASQQRVIDVAASLGASPADVEACYTDGGTQADIASCIQASVQSVGYQTNLEAPTEAQFLGGVAGASAPTAVAAFLVPLLAIWHIFAQNGHHEYEYLPTSLALGAPGLPADAHVQQLLGMKVPTLRPPAAASDVLFFTIGNPQAPSALPAVVDDASTTGMCATAPRIDVPLHLDRTSPYVHDTALVVTPDGAAPYGIPIDPHDVDAPLLARDALHGARDGGYDVRLTGRFGFRPLAAGLRDDARIALPTSAAWTIAPAPHRPPIAGRDVDLIASSAVAPCLSRAELQLGDAVPVPLTIKRLDDRRLELQGSPAPALPGEATIRLVEDDGPRGARVEHDATVAIAPAPAEVSTATRVIAYQADRSLRLTGSGFASVGAVRLNGAAYVKDGGATADAACFSGPPIAPTLVPGTVATAQLLGSDGAPGELFATTIAAPRPVLLAPTATPRAATYFSTTPLAVVLAVRGILPDVTAVRIRQAPVTPGPCDAVRPASAAVTLDPSDVHRQTPGSLRVDLDAAAALHDRAYGTLQVQLVDADANAASDWMTVPGTFVRAPIVDRIECPADPQAACTLIGSDLDAIAGIEDPPAADATPGLACTSDIKNTQCLSVPHLTHYTLRLEDDSAQLSVPDDDLVQTVAGKPSG